MTDALNFSSTAPRFALPLLFSGQSQKEVTVNEALVLTDLLLHPVVQGTALAPPSAPTAGQSWIVGSGATDAFAGHDAAIVAWTEGGWRFIAPQRGLKVYDIAHACFRVFTDTWVLPSAPANPSGGTVIDSQARTALTSLLALLRDSGILTSS
ncbi:DUF2793 domain-containing protein [Novosphingobium sp.]|uniref:DUF2793 domain-containing protein n=1 Tax=Novosphingobium sp. TaxID=1874826 RepID=UPI0038BB2377